MIDRRMFSMALASTFGQAVAAKTAPPFPVAIKLGQSLPLTGPHAALGVAYQVAARAAFEEHARGGGPVIELVSLDDGSQSEQTETNVKLLASEHGVQALFGFVGNGADRAGARAAAADGLPYVAPVSGAVELRTANAPGVFTFRASHADEIRYIARHVQTLQINRLALVYEYNFMGWELRDTVLELLQPGVDLEISLTSIDREGGAYSVPGAVQTALARNPQAIVLGSNAVASVAFIRAVREAGFKGLLYGLSGLGALGLTPRLAPLLPGLAITQVVPPAAVGKTLASRNHLAFCARNNLQASPYTMEAWIAASLFVHAMKSLQVPTAQGIAKALTNATGLDFGGYAAQWYASRVIPKAYVGLSVFSREGRLME